MCWINITYRYPTHCYGLPCRRTYRKDMPVPWRHILDFMLGKFPSHSKGLRFLIGMMWHADTITASSQCSTNDYSYQGNVM